MPYSMTGFATADATVAPFQIVWELRSVNHRFLDVGFRMPEEFRQLESKFRERASAVLKRGKVDCTLRLSLLSGDAGASEVDTTVLKALRRLQAAVRAELPDARPLSAAETLRWPGVIKEPEQRVDQLAEPLCACLEQAVAGLQAARHREGERIGQLLEQRNERIVELVAEVRPMLDAAQQKHRDKLRDRVLKLDVQAQPERLEQELALIAQRLDVTEEIDRLDGHIAEIRDVLGKDEPAGRRLDFLIQELNREANTFASKSQDEELTRRAVELKVLIEQMREQVQNIE
ncbi:MAG: YicC family protein [Betaproteobacteria bacterium]|nr:YicC family protein [Betaproteobacteria bacterium]